MPRCEQAQQANRRTFLSAGSPQRKTTVALVADRRRRLHCTSKTGLQTQSWLGSCAARNIHRNRCLLLVNFRGKTRQLSSVVSSLCSNTALSARAITQGVPKFAAWTSLPLKEGKPSFAVLSLVLAQLCSSLTRSEKMLEIGLPLAP